MDRGEIKAICMSERKGTEKTAVPNAVLQKGHGLVGDAHAGDWHRQVSLLSEVKIHAFNELGAGVQPGAFGENLVVSNLDFRTMPVGTRLGIGSAMLQITQIGKACHSHCQIYQRMGDCIMPREGVFARVIEGGEISVGDELRVMGSDDTPSAAVVTVSDRCHAGVRTDESGPLAAKFLSDAGYCVEAQLLLPDERCEIESTLIDLCDRRQISLIVTSGGTGFSLRDVTPEATLLVAHRTAPGIAEAIRALSMQKTPRAMLSRGVSVLRGRSLIVNLPGSPKAVSECLPFILPHIKHGIDVLRGTGDE